MDARAHDLAALAHRAQRQWYQLSGRRIDDRGIQRLIGQLLRSSHPHRAEPAGEVLRRQILGPGKGIDGPALPARDLGDDVSGRAKAVDAEPFSIPRHHQRAPADQAGAQQRRDRDIVTVLAKRERIARVGNGVGGIAAVARVAGKQRAVAEIFHSFPTIAANAAGVAEPGHPDPLARAQRRPARAQGFDAAHDFMAGHDRVADVRQFAVHNVKIGATYAAGSDPDPHHAGVRLRIGAFAPGQRPAGGFQHHRLHSHVPLQSFENLGNQSEFLLDPDQADPARSGLNMGTRVRMQKELAMTELAEHGAATSEPLATDAASQLSKANRYAFSFLDGARNVLLDEMIFAGNEFLDRAVAETRIFDEFLHKLAEAHSVKDYGTMYQECTRHQFDFIRRDTERLLKHSERVIDNTTRLVKTWRQN